YEVGYGGAARARLRVQAAVIQDLASPLTAGGQYYAFRVIVNRAKTSGTGSCSACDVPACIGLREIQLFQPAQVGYDPVLTFVGDRNYVFWQSSAGLTPCSETTVRPNTGVPSATTKRPVLARAWSARDGRAVFFSVI